MRQGSEDSLAGSDFCHASAPIMTCKMVAMTTLYTTGEGTMVFMVQVADSLDFHLPGDSGLLG